MTQSKTKKIAREAGFTLVELGMALLAIGFIVVFLASTLINIMSTYQRGLQLNQINAAARQINTDIMDQLRFGSESVNYDARGYGRLCVGDVAYIWNITNSDGTVGFTVVNEDGTIADHINGGDGSGLRLLRISGDNSDKYCSDPSSAIDASDQSGQTTLIGRNIDVLRFDVMPSSDGRLVNFHIVLSTSGDNRPVEQNGSYICEDASGPNQYCAFTDLNFTVYRRNKGNG
ncbi:MAG: type II secretion system GspH family protein [Candidatus Nomurabacteria bacterium]|jgi:type II secretory pathway pseudopilin PulG|nr:type II secretion system GspH family protein [Candidatus Nomurabacteria bacterium]